MIILKSTCLLIAQIWSSNNKSGKGLTITITEHNMMKSLVFPFGDLNAEGYMNLMFNEGGNIQSSNSHRIGVLLLLLV